MLLAGIPKSPRARAGRSRKSAQNTGAALDEIVGAAAFCHLSYALDGMPVMTPALCWREGPHFYLIVSRPARELENGPVAVNVCLTVSAKHSLVASCAVRSRKEAYRSAELSGRAQIVAGTRSKVALLDAFRERLAMSRSGQPRRPAAGEVRSTTILRLELGETSATLHGAWRAEIDEGHGYPSWASEICGGMHDARKHHRASFESRA